MNKTPSNVLVLDEEQSACLAALIEGAYDMELLSPRMDRVLSDLLPYIGPRGQYRVDDMAKSTKSVSAMQVMRKIDARREASGMKPRYNVPKNNREHTVPYREPEEIVQETMDKLFGKNVIPVDFTLKKREE